jgi:hypothetical protein
LIAYTKLWIKQAPPAVDSKRAYFATGWTLARISRITAAPSG